MRINLDGSQPIVLTPAGMSAAWPSWSPDGQQLAFVAEKQRAVPQIYLVPADGGTPKVLFADRRPQDYPAWSPDGKFIAFDQYEDATHVTGASIQVFNVATNQVFLMPGSVGLRNASWSPDGRFVAAMTEDRQKLMLFDRQMQKWTQLATATLLDPAYWSKNGKDLYYQDLLGPNQPIYRIHMSDHKQELVTTFETYLHSGIPRASLEGIAPDGSLIARIDRGGAYIFSLDLDTH